MTVLAENKVEFFRQFIHFLSIFDSDIYDPESQEHAWKPSEQRKDNISVTPITIDSKVSELPKPKEHKRYIAEPKTFIQDSISNSSNVNSLGKSSKPIEFIDSSILEKRYDDGPSSISNEDDEILSRTDHEYCIRNHLSPINRHFWSDKSCRYVLFDQIGKE